MHAHIVSGCVWRLQYFYAKVCKKVLNLFDK